MISYKNQNKDNSLFFFQFLDQTVVFFWRLGLGKIFNLLPTVFGNLMIIKHRGRMNGKEFYLPLVYIERDNFIFCTSLLNQKTEWVRNLQENPLHEVWMSDGWFTAKADILADPIEKQIYFREILSKSDIPARVLGLNHLTMTDQEINTKTMDLSLIRIQRQAPQTGKDGPGGLAWLWPFITIFLILRNRRRK